MPTPSQRTRPRHRFAMELLQRGIFHAPNTKFYLSTAHTDADIDQTLVAIEDALRTMRG